MDPEAQEETKESGKPLEWLRQTFRRSRVPDVSVGDMLQDDDPERRLDALDKIRSLGAVNDPGVVSLVVRSLADQEGAVCLRARSVLEEIYPPWRTTSGAHDSVPDLVKALRFRGPGFRAFGAAWALGEIRDERAVMPLVDLVGVSRGDLRSYAILALGKVGDSRAAPALIEVLEQVRPGSADEHIEWLWKQQAAAAWALGEIGAVGAIGPLIAILDADSDPAREIQQAIWCAQNSLTKLGDDALEALSEALQIGPRGIRWRVADVLGRMRNAAALEPLIRALDDEEEVVRFWASKSLFKVVNEDGVETEADLKEWWRRNRENDVQVEGEPEIDDLLYEMIFGGPFD